MLTDFARFSSSLMMNYSFCDSRTIFCAPKEKIDVIAHISYFEMSLSAIWKEFSSETNTQNKNHAFTLWELQNCLQVHVSLY